MLQNNNELNQICKVHIANKIQLAGHIRLFENLLWIDFQ